jgi:hypothetical protein
VHGQMRDDARSRAEFFALTLQRPSAAGSSKEV